MKGLALSTGGFILMLGAAAASDSDVSLKKVVAILLIGFAAFAGGLLWARRDGYVHL